MPDPYPMRLPEASTQHPSALEDQPLSQNPRTLNFSAPEVHASSLDEAHQVLSSRLRHIEAKS